MDEQNGWLVGIGLRISESERKKYQIPAGTPCWLLVKQMSKEWGIKMQLHEASPTTSR
jgi:hypothetical protein